MREFRAGARCGHQRHHAQDLKANDGQSEMRPEKAACGPAWTAASDDRLAFDLCEPSRATSTDQDGVLGAEARISKHQARICVCRGCLARADRCPGAIAGPNQRPAAPAEDSRRSGRDPGFRTGRPGQR